MAARDWPEALFAPESVALVGASDDRGKAASRPLDYLKRFGFAGRVYPVNPRRETVLGACAWPDLAALPEVPDHAFLLTDRDRALDQLDACGRLGVKAATILAGGFADAGPDGASGETRIRAARDRWGIRVLGPNSIGVVNLHRALRLTGNAALREPGLVAGGTAVLSQSGSMLGALLSRGTARGLRFSRLVSVGNEVDLDIGTLGLATVDDPDTTAFMLFLETVRRADRLAAFARAAAAAGKPVVAYKLGRSPEAQELAVTHTGAMLGEDDAADAFFRAAGIVRVDSLDGFIEAVPLLAAGPSVAPVRTRRPAVGVVATTGGGGAMAVDRLVLAGLDVPAPSDATWAALAAAGVGAAVGSGVGAARGRLVDLTLAGTRYDSIKAALDVMVRAPEFDLIVFAAGSSARFDPDLSIAPAVDAARVPGASGRLAVFVVPEAPDALARLGQAGVPAFRAPESLADAVAAALARHAPRDGFVVPARPIGDLATLDEAASYDLLDRLGIATPERIVVGDDGPPETLPFDYPVVAKLLSGAVTHKSDIGGVVLDVPDRPSLTAAFRNIRAAAASRLPPGEAIRILVAPMVDAAGEVMIGYRHDPQVGPLVLLAPGGVMAELTAARSVRSAPVDPDEAAEMIAEVNVLGAMTGFRGRAAADLPALASALSALSGIGNLDGVRIVEAEINPLRLRTLGEGAVAVDAVVRMVQEEGSNPTRR